MTTVVKASPQSITKRQLRVAFYGRVSTQEQNLEGYSPQFQKDQLWEHLKRKDYKGWFTKDEWHFFDVGSGSEYEEREGLQRLLALVRQKKIDLVLVWKIDRLSRNLSDLLNLFEEMDKYGVGFASVKEDLDFTGAIGKLIFQIFGALAEFERENIKMRTEEGKKASAMQGNYVGGAVPYGYEALKNPSGKGKKLRLVKAEAAVVKQIFEWFAYEGKAVTWIAKALTDTGIPKGKNSGHEKNGCWRDTSVLQMLRNEIYRGAYITNRLRLISRKPEQYELRPQAQWIHTQVDPAIDDVLFYTAQERLEKRHLYASQSGGGKESYMLRGKLWDMETGRKFIGYRIGIGTKHYRRKQFFRDKERVKSMSISANLLEDIVWGLMEKALSNPEAFLELHKASATKDDTEKLGAELRRSEEKLSAINTRIEKARLLLYESEETDPNIREDIAKFETERDSLFLQKKNLESELMKQSQYQLACEHLRYFSVKYRDTQSFSYTEKQKLIDMFVERVEIYANGKERSVKIYYRFDPKAVSGAIPLGRTDIVQDKAMKLGRSDQNSERWWVGWDLNPRPMP